jgi:cell division protein FtsB
MEHGQLFVLLIIVIVFGARIFRDHLRFKQIQPRENPQYQARIDTLEQRVRTLERIVTDKGYDLKREFEKL